MRVSQRQLERLVEIWNKELVPRGCCMQIAPADSRTGGYNIRHVDPTTKKLIRGIFYAKNAPIAEAFLMGAIKALEY